MIVINTETLSINGEPILEEMKPSVAEWSNFAATFRWFCLPYSSRERERDLGENRQEWEEEEKKKKFLLFDLEPNFAGGGFREAREREKEPLLLE